MSLKLIKRLKILFVSLFPAILFLLLLEVGVRILFPDLLQGKPCYEYHPTRYWTVRPNSSTTHYFRDPEGQIAWSFPLKISSEGLRDRDFGDKASNEYRIFMLGDSFVYGHGVPIEETIPKQLENLLDAYYEDVKISVLNGAVGMYAPWQSRDLLAEIGMPLEPDMVLLGLFTGNDIEDTMNRHGMYQQAYVRQFAVRYHILQNRKRWNYFIEYNLRRYWQTINACTQYLGWPEEGRIVRSLARLAPFYEDDFPELPPPVDRNPCLESELVAWYPELEAGYAYMWRDISGIQEDCMSDGVEFGLFAMPPMEMVYDDVWETLTRNDNYERGKIARLLAESAQPKGIFWLPVIEAFLTVDQHRHLYIPYDNHLNAEGCRFVAEILFEELTSLYPDELPARQPK